MNRPVLELSGLDKAYNRGLPGERPQADRNIAAVPLPDKDPLHGADGPLEQRWKPQPPAGSN